MATVLQILMLEDSENDAQLIILELERSGYSIEFERVESYAELESIISKKNWDIILSDYSMPQLGALEAIHFLKTYDETLPIIIVSGAIGEETAVNCMKAGANDFFVKGNLARLSQAIERELRDTHIRREQKISEQRVKQAQREFTATFEQAAVGMAHINANGSWIRINQKMGDIIGFTLTELNDFSLASIILYEDQLNFENALASLLKEAPQEQTQTLEVQCLKNTSLKIWVNITLSRVSHENGDFDFAVLIVEDITEKKQAYEAIKIAKEAAESANIKKSQFMASITHELRTPLNAIIGCAEIIQSTMAGPLTEKQDQFIGNVVNNAKELLSLINNLLDINKLEAGKFDIKLAPVSVMSILEELKLNILVLCKKNTLTYTSTFAPDLPLVYSDKQRLKQILINLLQNAIKFNKENGSVSVEVFSENTVVHIKVSDTGIGIPLQEQDKLFTAFYQANNSASKIQQGTGLGLFLTKHLIDSLGGKLSFESIEGQGTTIAFTLPIYLPEKEENNCTETLVKEVVSGVTK